MNSNTEKYNTNLLMFIQDDEGHWFKIKVSQKEKFYEWIEFCNKPSCQVKEEDYDGPDFDKLRCMHPCNYMFKEIFVLKETKDI